MVTMIIGAAKVIVVVVGGAGELGIIEVRKGVE